MDAELIVGPRLLSDGNKHTLRSSRTGAGVISQAHGAYHEATSRRRVFSIMTPVAGTTIVAANNSPVAAAAATILTLFNPAGSGVDVSVLKVWLMLVSGTPGAGAFVYNAHTKAGITAAQNATPVANYVGGVVGAAKGYTQTALTGGAAGILLRPFAESFAAAIAASTPQIFYDPVDAEIVLPEDTALTVASPATGTSLIVVAGITYEEVPKPN